MARQTREEKAAAAEAALRTRKVDEFKQRIAKAKALKTYSERTAWESDDRSGLALYELVRRYQDTGDSIAKKTRSLVDELQRALQKLEDNYTDVFSYSNPLATPGSDIEQLHATRKALREGIATLAYALGYHVPQIMNVRELKQHDKLVIFSVKTDDTFDTVGRVMVGEKTLMISDVAKNTGNDDNPMGYDSEESAWLAAATYIGEYHW